MNLADSMRSQDNINKVGHRKEGIKEDDKTGKKLPEKKTEVYKFR